MPVYVGIHLPRLSLEVFRPRWSRRPEHGCVVLDRDTVSIADPGAREAGVCVGMKRGGVLTLSPDTLMFERELSRENDLMREVAFSLMKFSPMIALCDEETIVIDVTASLRLFGGIVRLCHQMRDIVDAIGAIVFGGKRDVLRANARKMVEENFSSDRNYSDFIASVLAIGAAKDKEGVRNPKRFDVTPARVTREATHRDRKIVKL